jgi:hypothetical protein
MLAPAEEGIQIKPAQPAKGGQRSEPAHIGRSCAPSVLIQAATGGPATISLLYARQNSAKNWPAWASQRRARRQIKPRARKDAPPYRETNHEKAARGKRCQPAQMTSWMINEFVPVYLSHDEHD